MTFGKTPSRFCFPHGGSNELWGGAQGLDGGQDRLLESLPREAPGPRVNPVRVPERRL